MDSKEANIEESLPICRSEDSSAESVKEPTDDEINFAYNIFDAEKMKYFSNVFVKLNRDFRRRKTSRPSEWNDFAEVIKLCRINGFDLKCYIKYCFINRLVPKSRGKTLSDVSFLRNVPQVLDYARNKNNIERLYSIYRSIQKTIIVIRKMSKTNCESASNSIKKILSSKKLSTFISTGLISPYFIALIPNASKIIHSIFEKRCEDGTVLLDFCNGIRHYGKSAIESLSMFYPSSMTKTVVEMCS